MQDSLEEQMSHGSFTPTVRNDILTVALGTPDHPGRVRGVGRGVGIRDFFGAPSHRGPGLVTREEMDKMLQTVREEIEQSKRKEIESVKLEMMSLISSKKDTSTQGAPHSPIVQSTKGSCAHVVLSDDPGSQDNTEPCELYLEDPHRHLVARGKVHNLGSTVHHQQLKEDEVRVTVETVIVADASVPFPTEEVATVGEAPGNFIIWPRTLVDIFKAQVQKLFTPINFMVYYNQYIM